jgi:CRISPR/Cas system-associated exonuclease Cas4 (RecB family)
MLKELIDKFYRDSFQERERAYFYVTDAGKCPRAVYFQFKKAPRMEFDPRILRIFDEGDYTHMRLLKALFSLGVVRAAEIRIPPQKIISGRADAIVTLDDGQLYVVDFKSISSFGFRPLDQPKTDHIKQVQLYMHYFKIPRGILLYENKNTQELKEFFLEYDPRLIKKLLGNFEVLKGQIDKNIVPAIPKDIEKWRCRYCQYRRECRRLEKLAQ